MKKSDGTVKQKYVIAKTLVKDVVFEETHDNSMNVESEEESQNSGSSNTDNTSGGSISGSGDNGGDDNGSGDQ